VLGLCGSEDAFKRIENWEEKFFIYGKVVYRLLQSIIDGPQHVAAILPNVDVHASKARVGRRCGHFVEEKSRLAPSPRTLQGNRVTGAFGQHFEV